MDTSVINERLLLDFLLSDDENNNQESESSCSYDLSLKDSSLIVTKVASTQKSQSCSETEEPNVVTFIPDHEDNLHDKSSTIEEEDFLDGLEDMIGGSFTLTNKPNKVNDNPKKKNKKINNGSKTDDTEFIDGKLSERKDGRRKNRKTKNQKKRDRDTNSNKNFHFELPNKTSSASLSSVNSLESKKPSTDTDSGTITENDYITVKVEPIDSDKSIKNNNEKERKKKRRKEGQKKRREERRKEREEEEKRKKKEKREEKKKKKEEKKRKNKEEKKENKEKYTKNKSQKENKDTSTKDIETEVSTDVITISAQNLGAIEDTICYLDEKVKNFNNGKEINAKIPDGENTDGKGSDFHKQGGNDKDHLNVLHETTRQRRRKKKTKNKVSTKSTIEEGLQAPAGTRDKNNDNAKKKTFKFKKYQSRLSKTTDKVTRISDDYSSNVDNREKVSEKSKNKELKKKNNLKSKRNKKLLRKDKEINDDGINHKILKSVIEKEGNQSTTEQNIILGKELKKS